MTTLTGILDWPARAEGRVRQVAGGLPVVRDDDPFVPLAFGERYGLRPGLTITVEVGVRVGEDIRHPDRLSFEGERPPARILGQDMSFAFGMLHDAVAHLVGQIQSAAVGSARPFLPAGEWVSNPVGLARK